MKRLLLTACALMTAAPALAGEIGEPLVLDSMYFAAPDSDWTGAYAGIQLDYFADGALMGAASYPLEGTLYGVFGGYRYDFGSFVVGAEVDYMIGSGSVQLPPFTLDLDYNSLLRAGVEVGYDAGNTLIYGTAGYAHIDLTGGGQDESNGFFYGIGADYRLSENVTVGVELLQHEFADFASGPGPEMSVTTFGLNVAFTF